jgi:Rho termination factor, N-terminal domain
MAIKTQFLKALSVQEAAYQEFTHMTTISAGVEITQAGVGVAATQTILLGKQRLGEVIRRAALTLVVPFENTADAAFNSTTVIVKTLDSGGADKTVLFTAQELNRNGTEITATQVQNTPSAPALLGDTLVAVFTGMAAKALASLNKGQLQVYFEIHAPIVLQEATAAAVAPGGFNTIEQLATLKGVSVEEATAQLEKADQEERDRMKGWNEGQAKPGEGEQVDYESKTVPELKDLAAERGVDVPYDARKDEIIKALKKADKNGAKETAHA